MLYIDNLQEDELKVIKDFKDFCKQNKQKIPQTDRECLRFLIARKFDI
jgi:hypothetical protein